MQESKLLVNEMCKALYKSWGNTQYQSENTKY